MVKLPKISIIVPAYNEETKIVKCLESLLKQTYKNIEIFVIDDGSTDKTSEIVERFSARHKNIFFLRQKQQGPGAAKNKAAKKAKGHILVFVDSDEYPKKNYIDKLTEPIRKRKAKTTIGAWYIASPENPWARCRFKDTYSLRQHALQSGVFRAVDKKFFKNLEGFDSRKGYSDDRIETDVKRARVNGAIFYHEIDTTLKEIYEKRKWIGKSVLGNPKNKKFKTKILFLIGIFGLALYFGVTNRVFLLYLAILSLTPLIFLTLRKTFFYKDFKLIFYYPIYLLISSVGMLIGILTNIKKRRIIFRELNFKKRFSSKFL
tara:strand:+ start:175 stop:1128 length:954 start_codon:yes stop_codon:yes gene_type:complete